MAVDFWREAKKWSSHQVVRGFALLQKAEITSMGQVFKNRPCLAKRLVTLIGLFYKELQALHLYSKGQKLMWHRKCVMWPAFARDKTSFFRICSRGIFWFSGIHFLV